MQTDRTTKTLLFLIAVALWGHLLKPALAPSPSHAQGPQGPVMPVRVVGVDVVTPVNVVRQATPIEVRPAAGPGFAVQITGQKEPLNVRSAP